ncbi:TetR/AcrR family transcriptional regulator [Shewanella sp. SR43-4]|jgi:AcrR family transcriptional regulator|uniref:TetR/AcrR family transcriptional regulator n=1 Tax=Shewanella vesiculosa TaxID=518738 RepID=A0ABV0FJL7_9GAMM|nr:MULTISPECIES: TetR/AcrR family transcriptional regulator [Shewanella]NCQ45611.1 TetR/AcrR family transcriptional regulator [Shewanella frigidimarina]MBB1318066.1 TetR/AcrR family transcriptional regulator [Shewanella sp. SR43-4]MBB1320258.1 TetR/AcrR family transcriptional regulator [Shewanella sp. SR43-8]MBB1474706.1 TetR/AcrR family transcriptional regulator [Shewanella sp. SG41-3]NCO71748.1 TetR/AcrR family transcriptional regulator [Shewanella vesiculosa]|tara:strand:- start:3283 stop:3879 length:597 start_codon:yes stop_codon:yes gene_type:complete
MRHAEFNRETVLRAAMSTFLVNGFAKTSMQDLTKATGLHPGSIYCAFDNKKGLFIAAIEQYQQDRSKQFEQLFANDDSAVDNLGAYLALIVQECLSCDATQSCLLTKSLSEMGEQDEQIRLMACEFLQLWQQSLAQVFDTAKKQKLIAQDSDSQFLAQYLVMGIYGLRTVAHTEPNMQVLQPLADKLLNDLLRCESND